MENKKYILTNETIKEGANTLHRIKAVRDFSDVKKGDLGGYIESEKNLSHEGDCWVYDNAKVYDNAIIKDRAKIFDRAIVCNNAIIKDNAVIQNKAIILDKALICNEVVVTGNAMVYDKARIYNNAMVTGNARVCHTAIVKHNARVYDNAIVTGNARVCHTAIVKDNARILENAIVKDNAMVYGNGRVRGNAVIKAEQEIIGSICSEVDNYMEIKNPNGLMVTCILKDGKLLFNVGCQEEITEETFIDRIYNDNGGVEKNPHRKYYLEIIEMAKVWSKSKIK